MSSECTLFENDSCEIYLTTRITKEGVLHTIFDTNEGTALTTKQLRQVVERLQVVLDTYEEAEEEG